MALAIVCAATFVTVALLGEPTAALAATLPRIADWRRTTLPKVLSDAELEAFMKAFDCADPVGLRDYTIARCLLDFGLRGHEVTYLTLESVDWRNATLTISSTKSKRVQQLPLPMSAEPSLNTYARDGRRPRTGRCSYDTERPSTNRWACRRSVIR